MILGVMEDAAYGPRWARDPRTAIASRNTDLASIRGPSNGSSEALPFQNDPDAAPEGHRCKEHPRIEIERMKKREGRQERDH